MNCSSCVALNPINDLLNQWQAPPDTGVPFGKKFVFIAKSLITFLMNSHEFIVLVKLKCKKKIFT